MCMLSDHLISEAPNPPKITLNTSVPKSPITLKYLNTDKDTDYMHWPLLRVMTGLFQISAMNILFLLYSNISILCWLMAENLQVAELTL